VILGSSEHLRKETRLYIATEAKGRKDGRAIVAPARALSIQDTRKRTPINAGQHLQRSKTQTASGEFAEDRISKVTLWILIPSASALHL
jgi:hypothetical protein